MENKTSGEAKGIGVCGLLGVAFVILKLCHVIEWPWVWVTAPFWGPVAAVLLSCWEWSSCGVWPNWSNGWGGG